MLLATYLTLCPSSWFYSYAPSDVSHVTAATDISQWRGRTLYLTPKTTRNYWYLRHELLYNNTCVCYHVTVTFQWSQIVHCLQYFLLMVLLSPLGAFVSLTLSSWMAVIVWSSLFFEELLHLTCNPIISIVTLSCLFTFWCPHFTHQLLFLMIQ